MARRLSCVVCGAEYVWPTQRGRVSPRCPEHRTSTPRRERRKVAGAPKAAPKAATVTTVTTVTTTTATPPAPVTRERLTHYALPQLVTHLRAGCQPYLCGPAGSGKSYGAEQAAQEIGARVYDFLSCNEGTSEIDFFGFVDANGRYSAGIIRDAWEHGGVVLIDEIDACDPNALVKLNGVLALDAGKSYRFPDGARVPRHKDFYAIVAGNTSGHGASEDYNARQTLDASTLSRFTYVQWDYDEVLERAMIAPEFVWWAERVQSLRKAAKAAAASLVITPRATANGARLLSIGMSTDAVEHATVWKGAPEDTRNTVLAYAA